MKHEYRNIISFVWSTNIERSLRFYTEILGFKKGFSSDNWVELAIPGLKTGYLALNKWGKETQFPQNNFVTLGVDSIDDLKKHLTDHDVKVRSETEFYEEGIKIIKFLDPDGNTITAAETAPV